MNLINSIQSKLHGSINPNSVQYIRQQDLKVQLDPSGTDYVEYSGQASIFEEAHVLNPQGENTTALAILQKAPSTLPFSLASQDQFTICLKYKVHDETKPLLGYYFTTSQYDLSMNNSVFLKDDTIQVSVYKASEYPIDYAITGDLTSTDLNGATLTGTISESYTSLDYLVTSGYGQFTFTLNGTSPLQQISATVLRVYTVTVVYSATYGRDIYQVAELPNYYTDELGLIFNAGTRYLVDVSSLSNTYIPVFGTTNDDDSSIVNDTSIVNRVGDIIYVSPQQTLYMFNQANIHMTIPPIIYKNYKLRTSGQLTLNITTDSVVNMYLINGGGGGGRGSSSNSGHGGNGGSKYQRNNQSLVAGIYNIQLGPGATGGNSIQTQNDGGSSNYTKITYPDNTVYQTSGTGNTYGASGRPYGNGWDGANGKLISNFGAGGGSGGMSYGGSGGSGGNYGGGNGSGGRQTGIFATAGAANTGSGGGGGGYNQNGAKGGSGVFYIKLPANKFSYTGSYVEVTNFGD